MSYARMSQKMKNRFTPYCSFVSTIYVIETRVRSTSTQHTTVTNGFINGYSSYI